MSEVDEHGRPHPDVAADEATTLLGFLDYERGTLEWKCRDVDAAGLSAKTAASSMTLGGLLKHMAYVEDLWFSRWLLGRDPAPPWDTVDWKADEDWDWHSAAEDTPEQLNALWQDAVDRSRHELRRRWRTAGSTAWPKASRIGGARTRPACAGSWST